MTNFRVALITTIAGWAVIVFGAFVIDFWLGILSLGSFLVWLGSLRGGRE